MTLMPNAKVFFCGAEMTVEEMALSLGFETSTDQQFEVVFDRMSARGMVQEVKDMSLEAVALRKVEGDVALVNKIQDQDDETLGISQRKAALAREGQIVYPKVEIDFLNRKSINDAAEYCEKHGLDSRIGHVEAGKYTLIIENISQGELNSLSRLRTLANVAVTVNGAIDTATKAVIGSVDYTATNVVAPVGKAAIKTGLGLGRVVAKTAATAGASIVAGTAAAMKQTRQELAEDPEMLRARKALLDAKNGIMGFLRGKSGVNSGIRIG